MISAKGPTPWLLPRIRRQPLESRYDVGLSSLEQGPGSDACNPPYAREIID
jgi:hypothetical protein